MHGIERSLHAYLAFFAANKERLVCIDEIQRRPELFPEVRYSFYRTSHGAEIDLLLETGSAKIAIELKASPAPVVGRGFWSSVDDLQISRRWVLAPIEVPHESRGIRSASLTGFLESEENADVVRR